MFEDDDDPQELNEAFDHILSSPFAGVRGRSSICGQNFYAPGTVVRRLHHFVPHRKYEQDTPRFIVTDILRPLPCEATIWSTPDE